MNTPVRPHSWWLALVLSQSASAQVLQGPTWTAESGQVNAGLGYSVASAGDVDGDGYDDLIAGSWEWDSYKTTKGRACLYRGGPGGLSASTSWTVDGAQDGDQFGVTVASAGDVDGDGYADVLVGAPTHVNSFTNRGRVYLYLGSASGPSTTPAWTAASNQNGIGFGSCVASAGDVNGDGFDDVLVGALELKFSGADGRALLYLGSPTGPSANPDWTVQSSQSQSDFARSVASAGDVDGDGYDDVIVGEPRYDGGLDQEGRALVYMGSANGLSTQPAWSAESDEFRSWFGYTVAPAGDVDADGYDDVLVGALGFQCFNGYGRVFAFLGSPSGLSSTPVWQRCEKDDDLDGNDYGNALAGGDIDGDGFSDVLVGAPLHTHEEQHSEGRAFAYLGKATGIEHDYAWTAESHQGSAHLAQSIAVGDFDGNGCADVVLGAYWYDHPQVDEGRIYLYLATACGRLGQVYCAANPDSTALGAEIFATGSASSSAGDLLLRAANVPDQFGIFFHGPVQTQVPFGNGYLCTSGGLARGAVITADAAVASYLYDGSDARHSLAGYVGSTRHFQYWFRDPADGGAAFNTSNAISIPVVP